MRFELYFPAVETPPLAAPATKSSGAAEEPGGGATVLIATMKSRSPGRWSRFCAPPATGSWKHSRPPKLSRWPRAALRKPRHLVDRYRDARDARHRARPPRHQGASRSPGRLYVVSGYTEGFQEAPRPANSCKNHFGLQPFSNSLNSCGAGLDLERGSIAGRVSCCVPFFVALRF
jgi:hypothetical protein